MMPHTGPWKRPEPYRLPASSKSGDLPVGCHGWQVVTVLLAIGLFLAGPREISYFKRRNKKRLYEGYTWVSLLKKSKGGLSSKRDQSVLKS